MSTPYWITATPPTPDSELHAGHLTGPYVAADVLCRFLRADGRPVLFTSGTADHSSSVAERALRTGRKAAEVAEGYRDAITSDWRRSEVRLDRIVAPRTERGYAGWLRELFQELCTQGVIVPRTRLLPYCEPCGRWLFGARVTGGCPHCGAVCEGGACRECARPNDCGDLLSPRCAQCAAEAVPLRCRRLYLPLEPLRGALGDYWDASGLPPRLAALCEGLVEDGLPDVAVAHPGDWGVTVPHGDFEGHRIDGCFETAAMHLFGYGYDRVPLPERTVHFCGFGHAFCHAVLLPAILITQGVKLPQDFFVNEALRGPASGTGTPGVRPVGPPPPAGQGSAVATAPATEPVTARDWTGAWALDLLTEYGSDTLRRHAVECRQLAGDAEFSRRRLDDTRTVLHGTWNDWLSGLFAELRGQCGGTVPEARPGGSGWELQAGRLTRASEELREAYAPEGFDPRRAVSLLDEVVRSTADFGRSSAHERHRPGDSGYLPSLVAQLGVCAALTAWAYPVMPEGAGRLAAALAMEPGGLVTAGALEPPAPGTRLSPPSGPVFGF